MGFFRQIQSIFGRSTPTTSAKPEAAMQTQGSERRTHKRVNARKGTRVLIIDDSPTIVMVLKKMLRSAGLDTLEAQDGEQGVVMARSGKPNLIFLDIIMPGMNGFATLRALRRDPATRNIPVILISGNEQAMEQFYASRIGADGFMKKPFTRFDVFSRIEHLLDQDLTPQRKLIAHGTPHASGTASHLAQQASL